MNQHLIYSWANPQYDVLTGCCELLILILIHIIPETLCRYVCHNIKRMKILAAFIISALLCIVQNNKHFKTIIKQTDGLYHAGRCHWSIFNPSPSSVSHRHSSTVQIHSSLSNWDWKQKRCLLWSALSHQDASGRLVRRSIFLCHHSGIAEMIAATPLVLLSFRCSVRTEGRGNDADTPRVHLHHLPKLVTRYTLFNQLDWKQ